VAYRTTSLAHVVSMSSLLEYVVFPGIVLNSASIAVMLRFVLNESSRM